MIYPTLYKKTSTGATQIWFMEQDNDKYRTISGQIDGKKVTSEWTVVEPTNIGKKNERLGPAQAEFQINAIYKKKLDKDYHESIDNIVQGTKIFQCMLAEEYGDALLRKKAPIVDHSNLFSQPKLNGMRGPALKTGSWTRNGKPIVTVPHVADALHDVFVDFPELVLDGELYNHKFKDDFNEIISIFRQSKPDKDDLEKARELGQFHVYDITVNADVEYKMGPYILNKKTKFSTRTKILGLLQEEIDSRHPNILYYVRTDHITEQPQVEEFNTTYLEENYEGQIVRTDDVYENDRSWFLLKNKQFMDAEFILVDILPGVGNWAGAAKRAILMLPDGRTFKAGITGTKAFCRKLLAEKEKYIGKPTTVNFFQYTPDGIPLFGRCKEFDRSDI